MTEMGEMKMQLAAEAANDAAADTKQLEEKSASIGAASSGAMSLKEPAAGSTASAQKTWRDETRFTLAPGQGIEIKLRMNEGAKAEFAWAVEGKGAVNYDTHGDGGGRSISYEKGRGVPSKAGELVAAFAGNHGWFWRNRGNADVAVVLRTKGDYLDIRRPL